MTAIIDDFDAIGKAIAPGRHDLPALVRELKLLDQEDIPNPGTEEDRCSARFCEVSGALRDARATDLAGALAQLEFFDYYLDESEGLIEANTPAFRSAIAYIRTLAASSEPPPSLAGDEEMLTRFREWCTARRAAERLDDDDWEIAETYLDREVEELFAMPVGSPVAFAVKLFFLLRENDNFGGKTVADDPCALVPSEPLDAKMHQDRMIVALTRDMMRVVPELAPLCAMVALEEPDGPSATLVELIAEEKRLNDADTASRYQADTQWFAWRDANPGRKQEDRPASIAALYAVADQFREASRAVIERILAWVPADLGETIALLEWGADGYDPPELAPNILAGLRAIVARDGKS